MRVFPRIHLPRFRLLARRLRRLRRHVTVARAVVALEWLTFVGLILFWFTGSRAAFVDRLGGRADLAVLAVALALFGILHRLIKRYAVPALERYFSPAPYDERRILFDLGLQARAATNIDQLYKLIVSSIGEALETDDVSIFVREDGTGDYVRRVWRPQTSEDRPDQQDGAIELRPTSRLARDAFVVRRLRNLADPLAITKADFEAWEKAFTSAPRAIREARDTERNTLRQVNSNLLLQIRIKDQLVGILSLGNRRGGHPYSASDKEMLMSVAGQLAFVIENSRLVERMVAEERLRRELALAADVQRRLLPERPPDSASFEMSGFCKPAQGVGGDYYDFLDGDDRISIALADVSGKGIAASLVMSNVQAALRTMTQHDSGRPRDSLVHLVSTMNNLLCRATDGATYVTFFCARFDEQTRLMVYVNAGHNPPLLLRPHTNGYGLDVAIESGEVDRAAARAIDDCVKLDTGGPVLGIFENCHYQEEAVQLRPGDLLVAYTDGVTEALNAAGEEFGEARLTRTLSAIERLSADEVRVELVQRIQDWCLGAAQHDDLTFIVLKVK